MLIITRRRGETIIIGDRLHTCTVSEIRGSCIYLEYHSRNGGYATAWLKPRTTFNLDEQISIELMQQRSSKQARMAVHAPKHLSVHRKEVFERILKEQAESVDVPYYATKRTIREVAA